MRLLRLALFVLLASSLCAADQYLRWASISSTDANALTNWQIVTPAGGDPDTWATLGNPTVIDSSSILYFTDGNPNNCFLTANLSVKSLVADGLTSANFGDGGFTLSVYGDANFNFATAPTLSGTLVLAVNGAILSLTPNTYLPTICFSATGTLQAIGGGTLFVSGSSVLWSNLADGTAVTVTVPSGTTLQFNNATVSNWDSDVTVTGSGTLAWQSYSNSFPPSRCANTSTAKVAWIGNGIDGPANWTYNPAVDSLVFNTSYLNIGFIGGGLNLTLPGLIAARQVRMTANDTFNTLALYLNGSSTITGTTTNLGEMGVILDPDQSNCITLVPSASKPTLRLVATSASSGVEINDSMDTGDTVASLGVSNTNAFTLELAGGSRVGAADVPLPSSGTSYIAEATGNTQLVLRNDVTLPWTIRVNDAGIAPLTTQRNVTLANLCYVQAVVFSSVNAQSTLFADAGIELLIPPLGTLTISSAATLNAFSPLGTVNLPIRATGGASTLNCTVTSGSSPLRLGSAAALIESINTDLSVRFSSGSSGRIIFAGVDQRTANTGFQISGNNTVLANQGTTSNTDITFTGSSCRLVGGSAVHDVIATQIGIIEPGDGSVASLATHSLSGVSGISYLIKIDTPASYSRISTSTAGAPAVQDFGLDIGANLGDSVTLTGVLSVPNANLQTLPNAYINADSSGRNYTVAVTATATGFDLILTASTYLPAVSYSTSLIGSGRTTIWNAVCPGTDEGLSRLINIINSRGDRILAYVFNRTAGAFERYNGQRLKNYDGWFIATREAFTLNCSGTPLVRNSSVGLPLQLGFNFIGFPPVMDTYDNTTFLDHPIAELIGQQNYSSTPPTDVTFDTVAYPTIFGWNSASYTPSSAFIRGRAYFVYCPDDYSGVGIARPGSSRSTQKPLAKGPAVTSADVPALPSPPGSTSQGGSTSGSNGCGGGLGFLAFSFLALGLIRRKLR